MSTFKHEAVHTAYNVEVTREQLERIVEVDRTTQLTFNVLHRKLTDIDGVRNVDYSGFFGPRIELTVDTDKDNAETWGKIKAVIANHLESW